jgi:hypothetical protein
MENGFVAVSCIHRAMKTKKHAPSKNRASVLKAEGSLKRPFRICNALKNNGRGGGIRTPDPLLPKQMRYQTALRPDNLFRL